MKIRYLLLPLALLVAHVSFAQTNPSSPNSQNASTAVAASGLFIASYQENDQEDYYFPPFTNSAGYVFPDYSYSDINFTHWTDGKGGNGQWQFHDGPDVVQTYSWPATSFPQALPSGTGVEVYPEIPEIPPYTYSCRPPVLAQEHCNFSVGKSPFMPTNMQRTAETKMTLATGGAAGSTKMNLWVISATATSYALPWNIGGGSGGWSSALTGTPIASKNISVLGKTLGGDGNLYLLLPDNATPDATPVIKGGVDFYSFTISAQKCRLHILANGYPLAEDHVRPLAYYCVGQKLNFEGVFSPSPSGLDHTEPAWNYTADYINNHWTDANGCEEYNIAPIPAMSNPTTAWFYNKQTQDATANLGLYCKFNNGQSVYLVRQGKFNVFTPSITFIPSGSFTVNVRHGTGIGSAAVLFGVGQSDGTGALGMSANINSIPKFPGQAMATQLVNRQASVDGIPFPVPYGTGGQIFLDNTEVYPNSQASLTNDPVNPHSNLLGTVSVIDQPGIPITAASWASGNDHFNTYFRFRPDGDSDNIYVTLGRADWSWQGNVLYNGGVPYNSWLLSNWLISGVATTGPNFNQVNDFPVWLGINLNFP